MVGRVQKDLYSIEEASAELTLADSYVSDHRMGSLITLTNVLFLLEQRNEGLSPEEIQTNRTRYSMPIVNKIVEKLKLIRNAGNEYGQLVHLEDVLNRIIEGRDENGNLTIDVNTLIPCYYQPSLKIEKPIFVPKYLKEA